MLPVKAGLSVAEMVDRMTGLDSLDGWGVLVAYDESALNKLLAARHATLPSHVTTIPNLDAVVPGTSNTIKYRDIQLGSPLMKLNAHTNLIHLFFSISGWYSFPGASTAETPFDANVFLDVTAKLVTTAGHAGDVPPTPTPAGAVHVFEDSGASQCDAAIDLSTPLVDLVDRDHAPLHAMADVAAALTDHVSSVGLSYRLATVVRGSEPAASGVTLRPREFVMTAVEAKDGNPGALLIWIAVEGGRARGALPEEEEEDTLLFARRAEELCRVNPIPRGANACVVVSQEVFGSLFVKPQMERLNYSGVKFLRNGLPPGEKEESKIPKTGLSFEAKPPSREVKLDEINHGEPNSGEGKEHIDGVSFNMNTNNCKFFIDRSSSYAYLEYVVGGVSYYRTELTSSPDSPFSTPKRRDGKAKFMFRAKGDGAWRDAGEEGIAVSFTLPANFTVDVDPEARSGWVKFWSGVMDSRIKAMENLTTAVPDVTVDLGSIQLFLATSLLLPGEHIFKLKSVPDNLHMPHDIYLLGDI